MEAAEQGEEALKARPVWQHLQGQMEDLEAAEEEAALEIRTRIHSVELGDSVAVEGDAIQGEPQDLVVHMEEMEAPQVEAAVVPH